MQHSATLVSPPSACLVSGNDSAGPEQRRCRWPSIFSMAGCSFTSHPSTLDFVALSLDHSLHVQSMRWKIECSRSSMTFSTRWRRPLMVIWSSCSPIHSQLRLLPNCSVFRSTNAIGLPTGQKSLVLSSLVPLVVTITTRLHVKQEQNSKVDYNRCSIVTVRSPKTTCFLFFLPKKTRLTVSRKLSSLARVLFCCLRDTTRRHHFSVRPPSHCAGILMFDAHSPPLKVTTSILRSKNFFASRRQPKQ